MIKQDWVFFSQNLDEPETLRNDQGFQVNCTSDFLDILHNRKISIEK